jgi:hypothetical protein
MENPEANVSDEEAARQFAAFVKAQQEGYRGATGSLTGGIGGAARNPLPPSRPISEYYDRERRKQLVACIVCFVLGLVLGLAL